MKVVEFGDLFEFIRNGMNVKQDKSGDGLPITRIETISNSFIDPERVGFAGLEVESCKEWLLSPGDILFSHINSVEHIGKCAVYEGTPEKLVHGMNLLCLRPDNKHLLPGFAKYLIRSPSFRKKLSSYINKAVNQASVSIGNLKGIPVTIPELSEQSRIANILGKADILCAMHREALAHLDCIEQAIFMEMFGDPVKNPKGWKGIPMKEVAQFFAGNSLPNGEDYVGQETGYFLMRVSDMNIPGNEKFIERCQSWSITGGSRAGTCPPRSIVIPKRGGAIGTNKKRITRRPTILDPNLMAIAPNEEIISLAYFFEWFKIFDLSSIASGSSVPQLNKQDLAPIIIRVPPLDIQKNFETKIRKIEILKTTASAGLKAADNLFISLQHRAFSGTQL